VRSSLRWSQATGKELPLTDVTGRSHKGTKEVRMSLDTGSWIHGGCVADLRRELATSSPIVELVAIGSGASD
jgi:hypothetical protein